MKIVFPLTVILFVLISCAPTDETPLIEFLPHSFEPPFQVELEKSGSLFWPQGIHALNENTAFLHGHLSSGAGFNRSLLLRSDDRGRHWHEVLQPQWPASVINVEFVSQGQGWALVGYGYGDPGAVVLYESRDYGESWSKLSDIPKRNYTDWPVSIDFSNQSNGEIKMYQAPISFVDDGLTTLTTVDGGKTWQETDNTPWSKRVSDISLGQRTFESTGQDGSKWRFEELDNRSRIVISHYLQSEDIWVVVSEIPRTFEYSNGQITSPSISTPPMVAD